MRFKLLFLSVLMLFLLVGSVSALELNPFAEKLTHIEDSNNLDNDFLKENFNKDYGVVKISKTSFWFETDKLQENSLIFNSEQCDVFGNCQAILEISNYEEGRLIEDIEFKNIDDDLINVPHKFYIQEIYNYTWQEPVYSQTCNEINLNNGTAQICSSYLEKYQTNSELKERWIEYDINKLESIGNYKIKIEGQITERTDWIITSRGKKINIWAWWDTDWGLKNEMNTIKHIGSTALANVPTLVNNGAFDHKSLVTAGKSNADGSDIRVIDEGDNSQRNILFLDEFNKANTTILYLGNYSAGSTNHSNYLYYDNAGASFSNTPTQFKNTLSSGYWFIFNQTTGANMVDVGGSITCSPQNTPAREVVNNAKFGYSTTFVPASSTALNCGDADALATVDSGTYILTGYMVGGTSGDVSIFSKRDGGNGRPYITGGWGAGDNGKIIFQVYGEAESNRLVTPRALSSGEEFAVVITYNTTGSVYDMKMIWNGALVDSKTSGGVMTATDVDACFGGDTTGCDLRFSAVKLSLFAHLPYDVSTDWAKQFTYNMINGSGNLGTQEGLNEAPQDYKIYVPQNNTLWNNTQPTIEISNGTDPNGERINYTLAISTSSDFSTLTYINNSVIERANTTKIKIPSGILSNGDYWIRINGTDGTAFGRYENANFSIDTIGLVITNNFPINYFNSSSNSINFNITAIDNNEVSRIDLYINGVLNSSQIGNSNFLQFNKSISNIPDGTHNWTGLAWDDESNNKNSSTRTFTIDSTAPIITLNQAIANQSNLSFPLTVKLNVTSNDVHLSSCYYNTSETATLTLYTCNVTQSVSITSYGLNKSVYFCANDTYGNQACNTTFFNAHLITPTISESADPTGEGASNVLTLFINLTPTFTDWNPSSYLTWNSTLYSNPIKTSVLPDSYSFKNTFIIPEGAGNKTGQFISYTWNYSINGLFSNRTFSSNQTVYSLSVGSCGVSDFVLLNYTLRDEETKLREGLLNATIDTDVLISSLTNSSFTWDYANTTNSTNLEVCINANILNFSSYRLDVVTRYESADHVIEYNYIINSTLTNTTTPNNINLYDLLTEDATSFLIVYKDEFYLPVENAIIDVWRYYVGEGLYRSVEHAKTNDQGETRLHLVSEDVKYKFLVRKEGLLLYTSPEYLALCQSTPCQINLQEKQGGINHTEFGTTPNLDYTVSINESARTVVLTFSTKDGTPSDMNMTVILNDAYGNQTACSETETSNGGTLTCTLSQTLDNSTYLATIWKDGDFVTYRILSLKTSPMDNFGNTAIVMSFFLVLLLALMGISKPLVTIFLAILGLVFATALGILAGGSVIGVGSALIWLVISGVIIIIKIASRRNS